MLKFSEEHQSFNGSIRKQTGRRLKSLIASGVLLTSISLFSGCANEVECNIEVEHAHKYVCDSHFSRYLFNEKEYSANSYVRTDEYIIVDEEMKKLIQFENDWGLYRISENRDRIQQMLIAHEEGLLYEYEYMDSKPVMHGQGSGRGSGMTYYTYIPTNEYNWTLNKKHENLTGETREVYFKYYAYKIEKNSLGMYSIVKSDYVDNFEDLPEEYIYVGDNFFVMYDKQTDYEIYDYEYDTEFVLNEEYVYDLGKQEETGRSK